MFRSVCRTSGLLIAAALIAAPASAQVVQSFHVSFGGFFPRGFESRVAGDTIAEDLAPSTTDPALVFGSCSLNSSPSCSVGEFRSANVLGEWNVSFGDHLEVSGGAGYYGRSVPSAYRDFTNPDGSDITQDLHLRIVPITAVVRFVAGRPGHVQPYLGAGAGAFAWRYSEAGTFIDPSDFSTFNARYTKTGVAPGGVVLGGVRLPMGGDIYALTLEYRYQFAQGKTGGLANGFLGDKIDLSGGNLNVGFLIHF